MKLILQSTLRSLGITEKYAGFSLAVTAISLCFERPSRLSLSCPRRGTKGGGGCASIPSQDGFHIFPFKITCRFFTKYSTPE